MSWLAATIGGAFDLLGGGLNAIYNSAASKKQYKYNLALQQQAQKWQERMSNTAHQREVKDLRLAGLNPVLSSTGGASAGSVGATSVSAPAPANFNFSGLNSALDRQFKKRELKLKEDLQKTVVANAEANLLKTGAEIERINAETNSLHSATQAQQLENDWRESKHWREIRYGKELRELYPMGYLEKEAGFIARPLHSFISPWEDSSTGSNSAIVIKKGNRFTDYKYRYFKKHNK